MRRKMSLTLPVSVSAAAKDFCKCLFDSRSWLRVLHQVLVHAISGCFLRPDWQNWQPVVGALMSIPFQPWQELTPLSIACF